MNAIATTALEKRYDGKNRVPVDALRGITFQVRAGDIYALLGPNGAGKTTLISILTTLLMPTTGLATVVGYDVATQPEEVRRRIGVTFQEIVVDTDLTGRQVLDFHARLYGLSRAARRERITTLAALVELTDALDRKAGTYSGGMKRRLELARGLLPAPQVLFLDEPTQGLDPQNRSSIWRHIRRLRDEQGITVLLTTHSMEEAETLADRRYHRPRPIRGGRTPWRSGAPTGGRCRHLGWKRRSGWPAPRCSRTGFCHTGHRTSSRRSDARPNRCG